MSETAPTREVVPSTARSRVVLVTVVLVLAALFGPGLLARIRLLSQTFILSGDARIWMPPFLRYTSRASSQGDYITNYMLALTPAGFRGLMTPLATLFNPTAVGKVLSIALLIPLLTGFALGGRRLLGRWGMLATVALALSSSMFIERMAGGVARSFAYPVLALSAFALITGRIRWLCVLTVVGAAFYPVSAVAPGIALFLVLFLYPAVDRGEASGWSVRKRAVFLVAAAGLGAALLLPQMLVSKTYGPALRPADETAYPEIGPEGRLEAPSRAPFPNVLTALHTQASRALRGSGDPLLRRIPGFSYRDSKPSIVLGWLLLAVTVVGTALRVSRSVEVRRLLALLAGAVIGYVAAVLLAPNLFLPSRHVSYPVPVLMMFLLPLAGAELAERAARWRRREPPAWAGVTGLTATTLLCFATLGGRGSATLGLQDERAVAPLAEFVSTLPSGSLIAGWPDDTMDDLPYFTGRPALMNYECHQVFHRGFTDEMRKRFAAVSTAYLARDSGPLFDLRDQQHVTHMVVDRRYLREAPRYFAPFRASVAALWPAADPSSLELVRQLPTASVFQSERYAVLDLSRLRR
jgi:hypothetical protein